MYAVSRAHSTARERQTAEVVNKDTGGGQGEKGRRKTFLYIIIGFIFLTCLYFLIRTIIFPVGKTNLKNLNVILITIDTLRADYVSAYKNGNADTPALDALAKEGVLFERCIAQTPLTLPSHTTILSGTFPLFHRVRDNGECT